MERLLGDPKILNRILEYIKKTGRLYSRDNEGMGSIIDESRSGQIPKGTKR
jgi:hypothetical protein